MHEIKSLLLQMVKKMADRNTPASSFEEWRVEFNELATDVGDIGITGASGIIASATDIVEAITLLNTAVNSTDLDFTGDSGSHIGSVSETESLDFQGTANQITTTSDGNNQVTFSLVIPSML